MWMLDAGRRGWWDWEGSRTWSLVDRVALLAACKVVAVMLTIRAHASLFMPPNPHPTRPIHIAHSIVTVRNTDHIPLHPLAVTPPLRLQLIGSPDWASSIEMSIWCHGDPSRIEGGRVCWTLPPGQTGLPAPGCPSPQVAQKKNAFI